MYQPLRTPLCPESGILAVIRGYLSVFPFKTFYIADLNAIANNGNNHDLIIQAMETWPDLDLWIDSGLPPFVDHDAATHRRRTHNVLGTETGITPEQLAYYTRKSDCILSLDYARGQLLGAMEILDHPELLPQQVIIMSLDHVGSHNGPDLERLRSLRDKLAGKHLYAAGGVRNPADLHLLTANNIHGTLIATALHDGVITSEHI